MGLWIGTISLASAFRMTFAFALELRLSRHGLGSSVAARKVDQLDNIQIPFAVLMCDLARFQSPRNKLAAKSFE